MNYIKNLETSRIELNFEKEVYTGLSDELKKDIKSAYLWSNKNKCWVSRSTNNHYRAIQVALKCGFTEEEKKGKRLSYQEELEVKAEKAENRIEKYSNYSENAEKRAEMLQSDFQECRKDWSWLTQPIIQGHSGSRAFANHRNKVLARYEKGMQEYEKSQYYQNKMKTAEKTANMDKLNDKNYLHNRIKETEKTLKILQSQIIKLEETLHRIKQGEEVRNYNKEILTEERIENAITETLEKYDWNYDKVEFLENKLESLGGKKYSKENIKKGDIVKMNRYGYVKVITTGKVNIRYEILIGGAKGMQGFTPYATIEEVIKAVG